MNSEILGTTFRVAPWGKADGAEIVNTVINANRIQDVFSFVYHEAKIPLDEIQYVIPGQHGLDLDRAAQNLLRRKSLSWIRSGELVLVTAPHGRLGLLDVPRQPNKGLLTKKPRLRGYPRSHSM
jgi:hypothetical protein